MIEPKKARMKSRATLHTQAFRRVVEARERKRELELVFVSWNTTHKQKVAEAERTLANAEEALKEFEV